MEKKSLLIQTNLLPVHFLWTSSAVVFAIIICWNFTECSLHNIDRCKTRYPNKAILLQNATMAHFPAAVLFQNKPSDNNTSIDTSSEVNWMIHYREYIFGTIGILTVVVIGISLWIAILRRTIKRQSFQTGSGDELYRTIIEQASDGIFIADAEGNYIDINPKACAMFGFTRDEMLHNSMRTIIPFFAQKDCTITEHLLMRKDSSLLPVEINCRQLDDGHMIGILRDISERKKNENILQELFISVEQSTDAVIITDISGTIEYVNRAFEKQTGFTKEEARGKNPRILKSGKHSAEFYDNMWSTIVRGEAYRSHIVNRKKNGDCYEIEQTITPIKDEQGRVIRFVAAEHDVTANKRTEEALRDSEEFLNSIVENIPNMIFVKNAEDLRFVKFNKAGEELLGFQREELIGKNDHDIFPKNEADFFTANDKAVLENKKLVDTPEEMIQTKYRGERILHTKKIPILDMQKQPRYLLGISEDITERKLAEDALRDVNVHFSVLIEAIPDAIFLKDGEGRWLITNEPAKKLFQLHNFDWVGKTEQQLAAERPAFRAAHETCMVDDEKAWNARTLTIFDEVVQHDDGTVHQYEVRKVPLFESDGKRKALVIIGTDVTKRKHSEEALRKSEEKYRFFAENTADVLALLDLNLHYTYISPSVFRQRGFTVDEAMAQSLQENTTPETMQRAFQLLEEELAIEASGTADPNRTRSLEMEQFCKDGTTIWIDISLSFTRDTTGKATGIFAVSRDITERKRSEEKEKSLQMQLLQAQKLESLGTLAGGIAHDFNNILGVIIGHATLLTGPSANPGNMKHRAATVLKAAMRGVNLVKQLLTFARKTDVSVELLSFNTIVNELSSLLTETFPKTITISFHLGEHLPQIEADATQIHQVLMNLCVNARDAMPNGGTLTIHTRSELGTTLRSRFLNASAQNYLELRVSDSGHGMDKATLRRIFEPFYTTKEIGKGTGLGLSLVFSIVEMHNGFIDVQSEPGKGTTFTIYFPVPEQHSSLKQEQDQTIEGIPGGNETILVVEDEEMLLELLRGVLETKGYTVLTATDGENALEVFTAHRETIQLVMSDMGLPKFNGYELFCRLIAVHPRLKMILSSGYIEPGMKSEIFKHGVKEFVQKPYQITALLKSIRSVLDTV